MTHRRPTLLAAVVLSTVVCAQATAHEHEADEKAVRQAAADFYSALNTLFTGDVAPMKKVWSHADDVTYMGPAGEFNVGWKDVLANWEGQAAMKLGGRVEPADMRVTVGKNLAVVHDYEKGTNTDAKTGETLKVSIRATNVFRKENGHWKMIGHHVDPLPFFKKK